MIELVGSSGAYAVIGVVVIAVASLLGLVIFASREERFEDVVARQKKEREELIDYLNTSSKPSKSKKKQYKKKSKGGSKGITKAEEIDLVIDSQVPDTAPSSETLPEETSDVSDSKHSKEVMPKKKKHASKKNAKKVPKEDIVEEIVVSDEVAAVEAAVGGPDDLDLDLSEVPAAVHSEDTTVEKDSTSADNGLQDLIRAMSEMGHTENIENLQTSKQDTGKEHGHKKHKSKKGKGSHTQKGEEAKFMTLEQLMKELEFSPLGNNEVQTLIDALFDKQNELLQWQKPNQKNEHKIDYRKQVQELETMLAEERKTSQLTAQKLKDARNELNGERTQGQVFQSQAAAKMGQQTKEIQALQKRMETSHEKHLAEMQSAQTQIQRMQELIDGNSSVEVSRLKEEIGHLQKASLRVKQLIDDNQALMNELNQVQQSNKQLRVEVDTSVSQMTAYEAEMNKLRIDKGETETAMAKRLQEVNDQLLRSESQNQSLTASLEAVQKELEELRNAQIEQAQQALNDVVTDGGESSSIQALLDDATKEIGELKSTMKIAQDKLKGAQESDDEKTKLIARLESQLVEQEERLNAATDSGEEKQVNGIAPAEEMADDDKITLLKEKEEVIVKLTCDLKAAEENLAGVKDELETVKSEKADIIVKMEQEIESVKEKGFDAASADVEEMKADIAERKTELKKIEEIVEQLRTKNNELREKNWKVMDAVGVAESNAKKQLKELETTTIEFLGTIHPDVKINKNEPLEVVFENYKLVMQSLLMKNNNNDEIESLKEENQSLLQKLEELNNSDGSDLSKVEELEEKLNKAVSDEKNATLQAEHYKKVLEETESMLTKLKDGVEAEVTSWKDKVQSKDGELKEAQAKIDDLEKQLEEQATAETPSTEASDEQLNELKTENSGLRESIATLEKEVEALKTENAALTTEKEAEAPSTQASEEQLNELKSENSSLRDSIAKLEGEVEALKTENSTLTTENQEKADAQVATLSEKISAIESEKTSLSDELAKKVTELEQSQVKGDEMMKESNAAREEVKALQDKLKALEESTKKEKSNDGKDSIIEKLRSENASLLEQLQEERDRVIVDVEIPGGSREELVKSLESTQTELTEEKNSSEQLKKTVAEMEGKMSSFKTDLDTKGQQCDEAIQKAKELEDKYKQAAANLAIAEEKVKELENENLSKSQQIEKEINDAMSQLKASLAEKEKALEAEKQTNRQLRLQLVSKSPADEPHGTSV